MSGQRSTRARRPHQRPIRHDMHYARVFREPDYSPPQTDISARTRRIASPVLVQVFPGLCVLSAPVSLRPPLGLPPLLLSPRLSLRPEAASPQCFRSHASPRPTPVSPGSSLSVGLSTSPAFPDLPPAFPLLPLLLPRSRTNTISPSLPTRITRKHHFNSLH